LEQLLATLPESKLDMKEIIPKNSRFAHEKKIYDDLDPNPIYESDDILPEKRKDAEPEYQVIVPKNPVYNNVDDQKVESIYNNES